jgi:hypothetical protein
MALTKTTYSMIEGAPINVLDYGADNTGTSDSTAAIQAAINYAETFISIKIPAIYFPAGIYNISSGLTATVLGNHFKFYGDSPRSVAIVATAPMAAMLTIGTSTGYYGRNIIEGLVFDQNNLATVAFNGPNIGSLVTIHRCEFFDCPSAGTSIVLQGNNNLITSCMFFGDSGAFGGTAIKLSTITNSVNIRDNVISFYDLGIEIPDNSTFINIENNTFDDITNAAIFISNGCFAMNIKNNYFERCGNTVSGVALRARAGGSATYSAPIVAQLGGVFLPIVGLNVIGNQFGNCVSTGLCVLSGVINFVWDENEVLTFQPAGGAAYNYDYAVRFVEYAAWITGAATYIKIRQADAFNQYTNSLVQLGGSVPSTDHSGLEIHWLKSSNTSEYRTGDSADLSNVSAAPWVITGGPITTSTVLNGLYPIYSFPINATATLTLPLSTTFMKGQYFRLSYVTKGAATTNGVGYSIDIDTGSGYVTAVTAIPANAPAAFGPGARLVTFYVPATAVGLRIQLFCFTSICELSLFRLENSSVPI